MKVRATERAYIAIGDLKSIRIARRVVSDLVVANTEGRITQEEMETVIRTLYAWEERHVAELAVRS